MLNYSLKRLALVQWGSGSEASAEGELPKAEESHDTEILTTVPNSVAEGGEAPVSFRKSFMR
ncbi:hypothetical protein ANCCAN_28977 [Ancylostoma caninum]|uniref:Uncharacterized protein n=1 Tax=Ancylostoma caninum TaxID=29170 RepID=A0A368EZP9_ANCCA|nr:hypothetical protein ANCCAN_28977 [Ancylostoma caninum]